jgi:UDP-N-acetylglucosamine 2-epimerase (non-hydrolysing)
MKIDLIAGARPNFMKISSIIEAINAKAAEGYNISYRIVHTGQHYDRNMSQTFFEELRIPLPDVNLGAGGGSQAQQTAKIMIAYEELLTNSSCDMTIVVGDVNSTMACSIVAKKLHIPVAHVEAGIRSGDMNMPEEINRIVTDSITDHFFTTSTLAGRNLMNSGVPAEHIYFVGNTMIDTLIRHRKRFSKPPIWTDLQLLEKEYFVMTMHRPGNVDQEKSLKDLIDAVIIASRGKNIVFPIHPRTKKVFEKLGVQYDNLHLCDPLGYLEFNYLVERAFAVITDSGGITEETTFMGVPCLTLRDNTERPETIETGTNELIGTNPNAIKPALDRLFEGSWKKGGIPDKWDGKAADRIVETLIKL